jgi:hypothetical protein
VIDRREFLTRAAMAGLASEALAGADLTSPAIAGAATRGRGLRLRGVTYDIGTLTLGATTRQVWSAERMHHDIAAIVGPLHCSTVTVFGSDLGRLHGTALEALRRCRGS